jgi:hypothetical protein
MTDTATEEFWERQRKEREFLSTRWGRRSTDSRMPSSRWAPTNTRSRSLTGTLKKHADAVQAAERAFRKEPDKLLEEARAAAGRRYHRRKG